MKKWILGIVILLILAIASVYVFIPSSLAISSVRVLHSTATGSFRSISEKKKWAQWFPQSLDAANYKIGNTLVNTVHVDIKHDGEVINSTMFLLPFTNDSTAIQWKCQLNSSNNPFTRIKQYQKAVAVKKEMDQILNNLTSFVEKPENVYGFKFEYTTYTDTLLLATKTNSNAYPTVEEVYHQVNSIRARIAQQNATQTGQPLINVTRYDSSHFQYMVAIPVNRALENHQQFFFRRMIPGRFLTTEIKGGQSTVKEALYQMQAYIFDYRKTAMAIPFESYITDRQAEPDSTKWITRIYTPVF